MTEQDRLQWLNERKTGIGASDMYAICGVSPWGTALGVYLSKVSPIDPREAKLSPDDVRAVGTELEPSIAKMYAKRTGKTLVKPPAIIRHPALSWMYCSLDYQHQDDQEPVDCKNTSKSEGWGEEGTDQVPYYYAIQLHHQMEVTGANQAHLAVLFYGNQFKVYTVQRDNVIATELIGIGHDFWRMVEARTPPEPDWEHPSTPKLIKKLYNTVEKRTVQLGDETLERLKEYLEIKDQIDALGKREESLKAKLMATMGNAELAEFAAKGYRMTRKSQSRKETIIPAYSFIDFRTYRPKEAKLPFVSQPRNKNTPDLADSEEKEESHE